ncbi:MAG: rhodanese-like domain-containing protein [Bacillota bacterium]
MKKRYSAILVFLTLVLCLALAASAFAGTKTVTLKIGDPYLTVDGVKQEVDPGRGTKPVIVNGRTLVPIRAVIDQMGGTVAWNAATKEVTIVVNNKTVIVTLEKNAAKIMEPNATEWATKNLDSAPKSINGRTMVPVRFVTENLGAKVDWDAKTQAVTITFDRPADSALISAAADRYLSAGKAQTINPEDVYNKVVLGGDKSYLLVSLQSNEDYAKGHVKGAINIPYKLIAKKENLAKLPRNKKIVLICYTGHTASYAAMFLNELGYEAYAMKFGLMGWNDTTAGMGAVKSYTKSLGYPVETAATEAKAENELPAVSTGQTAVEDVIIAATDKYLSAGKAPTVNAEDIYSKVVNGTDTSYFLLSIQKPEDYAKGHVKGAINIPFAKVAKEENLKKLPKDKKIVVICYTGHTASYTAMLLNQLGYEAYAMKFGTMGWNDTTAGMGTVKPYTKSLGYPVEESNDFAAIRAAADKYLSAGKAPTVSPEDIYSKVVQGGDKGYFLVSLQSAEDYAKGHVKGAINIPYKLIAKKENLAKLPKDKKIVLICYTGHTASYAAMFLNELGYEAYAMKFGLMGWNDATEGMGAVKPYTKSSGYATDTAAVDAKAENALPAVATGQTTAEDIIIAATDKYLSAGKSPTVSTEDIYNKVVNGTDTGYFLLSIQKPEDYAKGHVKGAINIPFGQMAKEENLKKLPKDKKIVVICYTGHTASYTAMLLNQLGYEAYAMKFGTMGWNDTTEGLGGMKPYAKSLGYPVVTGTNP